MATKAEKERYGKVSKNWEQRQRKVEKRSKGMRMNGKGTVRQQNELREREKRRRSEDDTDRT